MSRYFSADFFAGNRKRLREQVNPNVPIVIAANGQLQKNSDIPYVFQQDASFWYLTGLEKPDLVLVMDRDGEYLIIPSLTSYQLAFDGDIEADKTAKRSGIKESLDSKTGWQRLAGRLKNAKQVATTMPASKYLKTFGMYSNPSRRQLIEKIKRLNHGIDFVDVRQKLAAMRMIKQPSELNAIRAAIDITVDSVREAISPTKLSTYKYEYEVENEIEHGFKKRGAKVGFDSVIASGANAATIHSRDPNTHLKTGDLLLMDVGAEIEQYDADITRTISLGSKPSKRQREIYNAVLEAQDFGFSLMKPGASVRDNEKAMEKFIGDKLRALGVIKSIDSKNIRKYYPHALSHSLGIDTHDAADYSLPLAADMVLTVEPGIYIPEEGIGVRIEDDVLITETGHEILSRKLPRDLL